MAARKPLGIPTASKLGMVVRCPASFWGSGGNKPQPPGEAALVGTKIHSIMEMSLHVDPTSRYLFLDSAHAYNMAVELDVLPDWEQMKVDDVLAGLNEWLESSEWSVRTLQKEVPVAMGRDTTTVYSGYMTQDRFYDKIRTRAPGFADIAFAGTADLVISNQIGDVLIIDWKTGAVNGASWSSWQLHGLTACYCDETGRGVYGAIGDLRNGSFGVFKQARDMTILKASLLNYVKPDVTEKYGVHCLRCDRKAACETFNRHTEAL